MTNVIKFKPRKSDSYFGGCPECAKSDGYMNVGRNHWFTCDRHKVKWHVGSNLFSDWRRESKDKWRRNEYRLRYYREVQPI